MVESSCEWTDMGRLGIRLQCAGLLVIPFSAVRAAPFLEGTRPIANAAWAPWIGIGLMAVGLYMLFAPLLVERPLRRSRAALELRGIDVDQLLLLLGVGGAAGASMLPLVMMALDGSSARLVLPWAAVCFIATMFWCWRFRHVLM
jgi:hypothetical protein